MLIVTVGAFKHEAGAWAMLVDGWRIFVEARSQADRKEFTTFVPFMQRLINQTEVEKGNFVVANELAPASGFTGCFFSKNWKDESISIKSSVRSALDRNYFSNYASES